MNIASQLLMKFLYNRIIIFFYLLGCINGQVFAPKVFSLRSAGDGEVSYFEDGFRSNFVAEIQLMKDSLTWFGTGQGLSMYDGFSTYTYQSTLDSITDIFTNPTATTNLLPYGGVSAIAVSDDSLVAAFAGDYNGTPTGIGLVLAADAGSWYETPPSTILEFNFIWDSLGIGIADGISLGDSAGYKTGGVQYSGTYMIVNPSSQANYNSIMDSVQSNTVIKVTNATNSKILSFTVQGVSDFGSGQVKLTIASTTVKYIHDFDKGFTDGESITFAITKVTKAIDWKYIPQPVDNQSEIEVPFGEGYFWQLPVTVPQANVTYDAAISGKYLWIASWAGGLRRFDLSQSLRRPQNIPMPMDWQGALSTCQDSAYIDTVSLVTGDPISVLKDYYLNPRDPGDGGNHNHKAFSVLAYDDKIWVGTANGINKGLIIDEVTQISDTEFDILSCIEWVHYKWPEKNISGNFVVALAKQVWNNQVTIWAATVSAGENEIQGLSYSRDDGDSWNKTLLGERVYNIEAKDSLVLVATASGLWKSLDGENWAKFEPAIEKSYLNQRQILSDNVLSVAVDSRDSIPKIWIGTPDGVALSSDLQATNWEVFQAAHDVNSVYAYPNPFSPFTHNQLGSDGYVRFNIGNIVNNEVKLDIFNFAMEKVHSEVYNLNSYYGALKWNGRDQLGNHVANGVYFIRLNYASSKNQSPGDNWTKLIVVK